MATLVIGIGTSGLGVLENAQQFNYEFIDKNTPDDVEYLCIDSEKASEPKSTAIGRSSIDTQLIPLDGIQGEVEKLRQSSKVDTSWFPSNFEIIAESGAAGGRPTYGRLGFWVYFQELFDYLDGFGTKEGNKRVLVVGSLTGGTGSGICVDLAYLIRDRVPDADLQAVFMIPSASEYSSSNKVFYENAYQALKSLEYYSVTNNVYNVVHPNGIEIKDPKPPYDLVSVLSKDYDQSNKAVQSTKMNHLSELISSLGLYVSSIFLPGETQDFKGRLEERRNDAISENNHMVSFSSFGIGLAQYPRKILEEYVALEYSSKIVEYWKDTQQKDNKVENLGKRSIEKYVDNALEDTLNVTINNRRLDQHVSYIAEQILQKRYGDHGSMEAYLSDQFNKDGVIYENIVKNIDEARNNIIKGINNEVRSLEEPQISAAKSFLRSIAEHLDPESKKGILTFWQKAYKISEDPEKWPRLFKALNDKLEGELQAAKFFLQDKQLLEERLADMAKLMKMSLLYDSLKQIGIAIKDKERQLFAEGEKLVNLDDVNKLETTLEELLNKSNTGSFEARKSHIEANNTSFAQVFYYYKKGNFDGEIEDIRKKLQGGKAIDTTGAEILEGKSLFDFLTSGSTLTPRGIKDLYFAILPNMMSIITRNLPEEAEGTSDIYSLITNQKNSNSISCYLTAEDNNLRMSPPAFMAHADANGPHGSFGHSHCLKLMYCSGDIGKTKQTANSLRKENERPKIITDDKPDPNAVKIPDLKDSIIFFREYSYYGSEGNKYDATLIPSRDVKSLFLVRDTVLQRLESENEFVINKLPYFNQLKQNNGMEIKSTLEKLTYYDTPK